MIEKKFRIQELNSSDLSDSFIAYNFNHVKNRDSMLSSNASFNELNSFDLKKMKKLE